MKHECLFTEERDLENLKLLRRYGMPWNPSPKVASARDLANKYRMNKVILILINERAGTFESVSYGLTKKECEEAKVLADAAHNAVVKAYDAIS